MLTPDEDAEYKDLIEAMDLVSTMQAKACAFYHGRLRKFWTSELAI
jgi:hypothetical protein